MFFQRGLRIESLHTDTKLAPFGGTVRKDSAFVIRTSLESARVWYMNRF